MKNPTPNQTQFQSVNHLCCRLQRALLLAGALAVLCVSSTQASSIVKANNSLALTNTASWVGGVVPGSADVARWDSTVSGANAVSLGTNLAWSGIQIVNPGGGVTITNDGDALTNGGSGIDMSAASQNLTLSNNLVLSSGVQNWKIASGRTLTLGGNLIVSPGGAVRFYFADGTATAVITNGSSVLSATATPNAVLGGVAGYGNVYFGTVNDVDFAAEINNANGFQIVGGATIGGLYTANGSGNTDPGNANVLDLVTDDPAAFGQRASNTRTWSGIRFNIPQANSLVVYNGANAWQINIPSGRTVTCNSILVTTNVGTSPVLFDNGAQSGGTVGFLRGGNAGTRDLLITQNNPAAPLVFQNNVSITEVSTNTPVTLVKMGVGKMIVQAGNTYAAGTKIYEGMLQVDAGSSLGVSVRMPVSAFLGVTNSANVFGGVLAEATPNINTVPITVFGGATNAILVNGANGQLTDGTSGQAETLLNSSTNFSLTYNSGSELQFVYSNSISPSTTVAPLLVTNAFVANPLTANGTVTVDVLCGSLSLGQFPLIRYSGTIGGGGGAAFVLGSLAPHVSGYISNNVASHSIDLVVTNVAEPLTWAVGNAVWDIGLTSNWKDGLGNSTTYQQLGQVADTVVFDDSASGSTPITVTLNTNPIPNSVTVNNTAKNYILSGNGTVSGSGSLTKTGPGTLTLATTNLFTGGINLNGGIVNFSTLTNLGAGVINFGGGTLQYASGAVDDISRHTVTFGAGGATIDVNGNAVTLANGVGNSGVGGLAVTGGTLTLGATNRYSGNTLINSGATLAFQNNTTFISNSAALVVNGTLDTSASAPGLVLSTSVGQILDGTGAVKGEVATSGGTMISPATNGTVGTLTIHGDLAVNGGTLAMDIAAPAGATKDLIAINNSGFGSGNLSLGSGVNAGTVAVNITGGALNLGSYRLITYSGTLSGGVGNLNLTGFSQAGQLAYLSSSATANGEIDLNVITGNTNKVVWVGGNNANAWDVGISANWTVNALGLGDFTNGNTATFDDTANNANTTVGLKSVLLPVAVTLNVTNNNYILQDGSGSGAGVISGSSSLTINGPTLPTVNVTTLLTPNGNSGPTTINGSGTTLLVGNGGTTGDIGTGNVTNNGTLIFDQVDNRVVLGQISGTGKLIQEGPTALSLFANNNYSGQTIISNANSTLQIGSGGAAGALGSGPVIDNGNLVINRSGSYTLNNGVSGSGSVAFAGPAAITLGGSITYQGSTSITNGSVKLTANEQIPDGRTVSGSTGVLGLGGRLDLGGFNETINALTDLGVNTGLITNTGAAGTNVLTILNSVGATYSGMIADSTNGAKIQVVLVGTNTFQLNNTNSWSGGMIIGSGATLSVGIADNIVHIAGAAGTGNITMSNGATINMPSALSTAANVNNPILILTNSSGTFLAGELANNFSGNISGDVTATNVVAGPISFGSGTVEQYSNFLGTVLIPSGGTCRFSSTGLTLNGGDNTTFDVEGTGVLQTRNAGNVHVGALVGNGSITEPQATIGFGNFLIGFKNTDFAFSGTYGGSNNLVKVGSGKMTFNGVTNTVIGLDQIGDTVTNFIVTNFVVYVGDTTISNGVLSLLAPNNFNGEPSSTRPATFTLAGTSAILDLSSAGYSPDGNVLVTNSVLRLGLNSQSSPAPQTLSGIGTIMGSVVASNGTTVAAGLPTGVLTVTNSIELAGVVNMNLVRTNTPNCSEISSPTIIIDTTATLVVTNIGPAFQGGEVFHLFSGAVAAANFASITLPTVSSPLSWTNKLAIDGTIAILGQIVNTNVTAITNTYDGTNLTLTWPVDHTGWHLLAQTNKSSIGLSNNWVVVTGSDLTNVMVIPVNRTNGTVFYRLTYP